jgi:hypothetical protein
MREEEKYTGLPEKRDRKIEITGKSSIKTSVWITTFKYYILLQLI